MTTGFVCEHCDLVGIDDLFVIDGHVIEEAQHVDLLLKVAAFQIGVGLSGDGKDRSLIKLCVVKTVQEVYAARTGGGQTATKTTCVFRVSAGHEGSGLFMPDLKKAHAR